MPTQDQVLDVRQEAPRRRHELIFENYAGLSAGESYVLVNDHDPKPLRYQFEAEHAGEFTWDYLEEGPQVWRVRIGRPAAEESSESSDAQVVWPDWSTVVAARDAGPDVRVLHESEALKVVLVALAPGQALPPHPGPAASFHILSGTGAVVLDGTPVAVSAGATVVVAPGRERSVRAETPLVFLGNLGDPGSEDGPH